MSYTFAVVTETSPIDMAFNPEVYIQTGTGDDGLSVNTSIGDVFGMNVLFNLRTPNFVLGEILILDGDGREVDGSGRKPDKWAVKVERFADLDAAVRRAEKVRS